MNKHCYRLRVHRRTGQLTPVAEIHTGASRGGTRRPRPRRALSSLSLASLLLAPLASAQIVPADKQANMVTVAPNGVPVINIAAPDARGLSHNRFSHLDVPQPGVVFNNSKSDGRSQLAGYILKNPRLGGGPQATSILAEVTSPGPASRLGGALEVFGQRSQLIIANPNGISVNGLSTINTHALTLSTGSTQGAEAGSLHTRRGRIDIESDGVNTDGLASFDLIAQRINIEGPIGPLRSAMPARIGVHAGTSRHDLNDGRIVPQPSAASSRPAISASALGAMHGAHIRLEVTDSGAGVRLQGALLSSSDITIRADGAVLLAQSAARRDTLVAAGSDVRLAEAGGILTGQALKITTPGRIQTGGKIQAGTLQVQAASLSQTAGLIDVQGGPGQLAAKVALNGAYHVGAARAGLQVRRGDARIRAATLDNLGLITTVDGKLELQTADTLLNRGRIEAGSLLALATQGAMTNTGRLQGGNLELHAGTLSNTGRIEAADDLDIEAAGYRNSAHIGGKRVRVRTGTELVLDNPAPLATEALTLAAPKIIVLAELATPASLVLQGGDGGIDNHAAIASAGGILLRTQGDIRNHDGALIWAGARLGLQGRSIFNGLHGLIHSEEDMSIKASRLLRNHAGRINSRQAMLLETPLLENLSRLSGKVSVDTSPGSGHAWFPEVKKRHHLRIVSMRIGKLNTGRAVSSLHLEQGVIHAGKNMDITPSGEGPGKVHNEGRLTADGVQRIHADVRNASLSQAMTLTDYFKHLPGPQVWAQDNLAVLNPLTQHFPTLYDLLDHIFEHYEYEKDAGWTPIFVAYKYKHSWLSDSLAGGDLQHAPLLAKALGLALGGDWRGLSDTDRARRWAEFKAGRRGQDLPFYPAQPTVLGGRLGTDIQGRVANGEHVADVQASPVDPALQQAVADAQKQWRRGPPGEPAPEAAEPAEQDAGRPQDPAAPLASPAGPARKNAQEEPSRKHAGQQGAGDRRQANAEAHDREFQQALDDTLSNAFLFRRGSEHPTTTPAPYYETRIRFVDQTQFYGSAYFFEKIGYIPQQGVYVSGDNYFDSTLIRREAERLMGAQTQRRVYQDDVRQLMDNASAAHATLGLVVGQAPTPAQLAQLRDDIVWYVWHDIDGQRVLMPKVYLSEATLQATATQKAAGGAAIVSAGDIRINGGSIDQKNALIEGRNVLLGARDDIRVANSHGVLGGLRADHQLTAQARDIHVQGGVLSAENITLDARRDLTIIVGKTADAEGSARRDAASLVQAADQLELRAGEQINSLGAQLAGQTVALVAGHVNLGEIREHSGTFAQTSRTGFLSYAIDTQASTRDQGKGTTLQAGKLLLDVKGDMAMLGGQIQATHTEGKIGGNLVLAATTEHQTSRQEHDSFQLVANGRAGAGGKEASFSVGTLSPVQTQAGDGQMAGAELKTGVQIAHRRAAQRAARHHNAAFNLGDGRLDIGGVFDLGGADINADRAEVPAANAGELDIRAARIESSKYLDTSEQHEESWSLFIGSKSNANSSILDVATHASVAAQQAAAGREIDPALMAAQVAGDVSNLLLNDTGELATGVGAEFNYNRSSRHRAAENTSKIGGSIRLLTTQGDINLAGVQFSGGARVDLESAGGITMRAAKTTETASGEQHHISVYRNATSSCNAVQGSCGAGINTALAGAHSFDERHSLEHVHGRVQAREVRVKTRGDLQLSGARIEAARNADIDVGGKLRIQTVQDIHRSSTTGGNWNLSLGAAVNNRTIGTLTGNIGATVRHEHDHSALAAQIAGIDAGGRLGMTVKGDATLIGGALTARGPGSLLDIQGRLDAREVKDYRDHDGGYSGGSVGISASTSLTSGSISGGRIAGEQLASTVHGTIDIGQRTGRGQLQAGGGVSGTLNQDAGKVRSVEQDRKWAQSDISITLSKLDLGGKKAKQQREKGDLDGPLATDFQHTRFGRISALDDSRPATKAPHAPASPQETAGPATKAPYGRRLIVLADDSEEVRQAGQRLLKKHPQHATLLRADQLAGPPGITAPGPAKIQIVGHGKTGKDGPKVGDHTPAELARLIAPLQSAQGTKVTLVSCHSGACPGQDASSQLQRLLPQAQVKGYAGRIDVNPQGRKQAVATGGLQDKESTPRNSDTAAAELIVNKGVAISHMPGARQLVVAGHGGWKEKTREKTFLRRQQGDGYFELPARTRLDFYTPDGEAAKGTSAYDEIRRRPQDAALGLQPKLPLDDDTLGQLAASRNTSLETIKAEMLRYAVGRMDSIEGAQQAKNYAVYPHEEMGLAFLKQHHQDGGNPLLDLAIVTDPRHKVHLSTILEVAAKAGHQYDVVHYTPCRVCRDGKAKATDFALGAPVPAAASTPSGDAPASKARRADRDGQGTVVPAGSGHTAAQATPSRAAGSPQAAVAAPSKRYDFRIVGYQEDDARGAEAARRLFGKHPDNAMLVRFDQEGDFTVAQRSPETPVGVAKLQLVGHHRDGLGPNLGGANGRLLAEQVRALDHAYGGRLEFGKITLVGCNTGACPDSGLHEAFRHSLPHALRHRTVGYDGLIDVTPDGRKVSVTEGGLGPKRLPARATAAAAPSPAAPSAAPSAARTRPAAGARPAATGARPPATGARPPATGARPKNAKAASKSAMAQAPADVLAGYLADPSNKRRFDFVLGDQMSTLDLSDHPYYRVEGMHTIKTQDKGPEHHYVNTFTPETWTLLPPSQRPRHETRYNTADVILSQYLTAARADGFEDQRPGKLVFMLDSQDRTAPFRNADGEVNSERFLSGTRAGRQAQRLMDALDLTIDRIQFNPLIDRLDLHVSTLPGASTTDILSRHLAQPERRQAMDLLQQAFITQRQDRGGAAGSVGGTYALSDLPPDQPINLFVNSFSPDRWIMHQNWRQNAQRPYFANDVVLAQYSIAAKAHGYYGRLPRTIVRDNIVNETSQAFFAAAGARPDLQGFLTKTPNGKHTQRILDSLDMRATGLQWLPEDRQAIITVQPKVEPAKPRAEPARPKAPPAKATSRRPTAGH
ncbi:Filamentous hemagglutinin [Bordetella hinzii]|nr:Filamentous hemagglutinin [Bordetella hinzii]